MAAQIAPIVAVDTMSLIWGIRQYGPESDCARAKWLFRQFSLNKTQVIVPAISLSEYLTAVDPASHAAVTEEMKTRFLIMPFNDHCSARAAELFQVGQPLRPKNVPMGRTCLRADTLIIATAIEYGAINLYSADKNIRNLANKVRKDFAIDLPAPTKGIFGQELDE